VTARSQCEQVMPFTSNVWFIESLSRRCLE
jgi:hypothetical protein